MIFGVRIGNWREIQIGVLLSVFLLLLGLYLFKYLSYYKKKKTKLNPSTRWIAVVIHLLMAFFLGYRFGSIVKFDSFFPFMEGSEFDAWVTVLIYFDLMILPIGFLFDWLFVKKQKA